MPNDSLSRALRRTIDSLNVELPEKIADSMLSETMDNFEQEGYGNDGSLIPWSDRYGPEGNVEDLLRYPKLDYTGELKSSITPESGRGYAQISSSSPKAAIHNEGLPAGGQLPMRTPPASSRPVALGANPIKRQFMGVGQRTYDNVENLTNEILRRIV